MKNTIFLFLLIAMLFSCQQESVSHKIMSFNIRIDVPGDGVNNWHNRKNGLTSLIQFYQPDIISFQEVFKGQRTYLDSALNTYHSFGLGRDGNIQSEALPIFYKKDKYELIENGTFWLSETQDTASMGWDAAYPRICTYGKFKTLANKKEFWVFNIHLDNKGDTARFEGAKQVLQKINDLTENNIAVMLMGDLNCTPNSKPVTAIKKQLKHGFNITDNGLYGPNGTYNGFNNNIIYDYWIDYIFAKNIQVKSYAHIDDKLPNNNCISDHLPVLMEYTLN